MTLLHGVWLVGYLVTRTLSIMTQNIFLCSQGLRPMCNLTFYASHILYRGQYSSNPVTICVHIYASLACPGHWYFLL